MVRLIVLFLFIANFSYGQTAKGRHEINEYFTFKKDSLYWHTVAGTVGCKYTIKKDSIILYTRYATFRFAYKKANKTAQMANVSLNF